LVSDRLLAIIRCPDCGGTLDGDPLRCSGCERTFERHDGYLPLHASTAFAEQTKYLDEALHADARHEHVSPPLLSAGIRNDMLREFLRPSAGDTIVDLGCGSGRALVWNRDAGAYQVGIDVSPFFAHEAIDLIDLALGDLRQLPFADAVFSKAWTLDVLEHLSRPSLERMLAEAARVLAPGGQLFVYSHVRRNSRLAAGLRWINALARWLERAGLIDLSRERLRKSDHVNPLADIPDLERTIAGAGFRIRRIRYYTPLVGGFVENICLRIAEHVLTKRAARTGGRNGNASGEDAVRAARRTAKQRIGAGGTMFRALQVLTWMMKLDLVLFGRVRSGPFFALLEKRGS
jgi:SAM-dependent methyltransferase